MDLFYSIGPDGGALGDDSELRWSLRSVAKFGRNVGRVIVGGHPPAWLSDEVVRFDCPRVPGRSHFALQWDCTMAAIDAGLLRGEFLIGDDDMFLTEPLDFSTLPFYRRLDGGIRDFAHCGGGVNYRRMMDNTRRALAAAGYGTVKCNMHRFARLDAADAPEARRVASLALDSYAGVDRACVFQNIRAKREKIEFRPTEDLKLASFNAAAVAGGVFSIRDAIFKDPAFTAFMRGAFGAPCKYEKDN